MKRLKKSLLYTYGVADMFFVLMVSMELYYFAEFLYGRFSQTTAVIIYYTTAVFDIVCCLLSGIILEKINLKFGGKYRSWFLVGPVPIVLFFMLQFTKIGSEFTAAIFIIIGFIVSHLLWNTVAACGGAMVGQMSKDPDEQTILSSSRTWGMTAAGLIFSLSSLYMIDFFTARTSPDVGRAGAVLVYGVMMIFAYLYIYRATTGKDNYVPQAASVEPRDSGSQSVLEIFRLVCGNRPLLLLIVAEIFRNGIIQVVTALAVFYFTYVYGDKSLMTTFMLVTAIASLLGALLGAWVGLRLGKRKTYWLPLIVAGVIYASARFFGTAEWSFALPFAIPGIGSTLTITSFTILFGLGSTFASIASCMCTALFSDMVVYCEWKTGNNIRAFTMSLLNLSIKLSVLLKVGVVTCGFALIGFVESATPTRQVIDGIASLIAFATAGVCILAAVIFFFGYKVQDGDVVKMQADIAARSAGTAGV